MAHRKDKNKVEDEVVCSAAASKRRRIENLNGTNAGVPFRNPITQFPSIHFLHQEQCNPPPNTTTINTDLQLSPPAAIHQNQDGAKVDDILPSLMPQQNFLISYHINQMQMSVKEFWQRNFVEEEKKRKEIETKLKEKEQEVYQLREKYFSYEKKTFRLEEILEGRMAGEAAPDEEVESGFVDPHSVQRKMDTACRSCRSRPATMLWLPCRHVCVCYLCERRVKQCPICGVQKTESFMINLSPT